MTAIATELGTNSGTKTTDGTEQTLGESTSMSAGGVFELGVDFSANADGDIIELRAYTNNGVDAAYVLAGIASFAHVQAVPWKRALPIAVESGGRLKYTIKKISGTNRDYDWKVMKL